MTPLFPATVMWWWGESIFNPVAAGSYRKEAPTGAGREAASNDVSSSCRSGDYWMYAKEDPRELPWKIFPTTKPGDLKPLGGVERFESRTLICRLIAHRIWIVFLSVYKTYKKERINKEDSVVRSITTPKSNLATRMLMLLTISVNGWAFCMTRAQWPTNFL